MNFLRHLKRCAALRLGQASGSAPVREGRVQAEPASEQAPNSVFREAG
jgi:hypothetical protein